MNIYTKTLLLLYPLALYSCKKETTETTRTAYVSLINASPTLATYDMYLSTNKVNTGAIAFGGIINYMQMTAGVYPTKFTTDGGVESLFTKDITLVQDSIYSLFLIDKLPALDILLVSDKINGSLTEKAHIRFINLCPDAPSLALGFSTNANLISGITYKKASPFVDADAGDYVFEIRGASDGIVKTSLASQTLTAGHYYTIISRGMFAPLDADQPFSGQFITNY